MDAQHVLFHASGALSVLALGFRGQLKLRFTLFLSILLGMVLRAIQEPPPDWQDEFWYTVTLIIDVIGMAQIVFDRTHFGLSADEEELFHDFGNLTPGEFRQLVKLARWNRTDEPRTLTREDERPDRLFYVLEGSISVEKGGRTVELEAKTFIGEIAFLRDRTASATVTVAAGSRTIEWNAAELNRYLDRHPSLKVAVNRLLAADMAMKVAKA